MRGAGAALHHLLLTATLSEPGRNAVLQRMATPRRHYHGIAHLVALWMRHRRFGGGTPFMAPGASRLIACTIAFHDAVYDPMRRDNEHRSAQLWRFWAPVHLSAAEVEWVAATIEATADHLAPRPAATFDDRLRLWFLDLDLTPLGDPPEAFARATHRLRAESRRVPQSEWERNRRAFLLKVQAAPVLFRSAPLAAAFEQQARRNIAEALGHVWRPLRPWEPMRG